MRGQRGSWGALLAILYGQLQRLRNARMRAPHCRWWHLLGVRRKGLVGAMGIGKQLERALDDIDRQLFDDHDPVRGRVEDGGGSRNCNDAAGGWTEDE